MSISVLSRRAAEDVVQASASPATVTITITNPLMFAGEAQDMLTAAGARWRDAGIDRRTMGELLRSTTIVVTDLPGAQLASVAGSVIYIDINAAGHGWFVDATPRQDSEFARRRGHELHAGPNSPAAGEVDLLTALSHELGHRLGLQHSDRAGDVMNNELGAGTRRSPSAFDAAIVEWMYHVQKRRG
jgi:hypothetical protein